jgi:hypothetical protein
MSGSRPARPRATAAGYRGKQARTGNSLGFRFDRALFRSHPEFSGDVRAHVIAPGRMLVVAEETRPARRGDPVLEAFLGFLAEDMARSPQQIKPLDRKSAGRIAALVRGVPVEPDQDLGDEPLL